MQQDGSALWMQHCPPGSCCGSTENLHSTAWAGHLPGLCQPPSSFICPSPAPAPPLQATSCCVMAAQVGWLAACRDVHSRACDGPPERSLLPTVSALLLFPHWSVQLCTTLAAAAWRGFLLESGCAQYATTAGRPHTSKPPGHGAASCSAPQPRQMRAARAAALEAAGASKAAVAWGPNSSSSSSRRSSNTRLGTAGAAAAGVTPPISTCCRTLPLLAPACKSTLS